VLHVWDGNGKGLGPKESLIVRLPRAELVRVGLEAADPDDDAQTVLLNALRKQGQLLIDEAQGEFGKFSEDYLSREETLAKTPRQRADAQLAPQSFSHMPLPIMGLGPDLKLSYEADTELLHVHNIASGVSQPLRFAGIRYISADPEWRQRIGNVN